ncbi:MAG: SCP2 sterol-binding domain-containing protein [Vicinamibacteria bacterium]
MAKSEVAQMFESLPKMFVKGSVKSARTFYFSLDDVEKWTVTLSPEACSVKPGKTDEADCFFKSTSKVFLDVWSGKKTPSATDFITGTIKSNNPLMLKEFVGAFQKKT